MSAVVERLPAVARPKRDDQAPQLRIDESTPLFQPWALKAMSIIRIQARWRVRQ